MCSYCNGLVLNPRRVIRVVNTGIEDRGQRADFRVVSPASDRESLLGDCPKHLAFLHPFFLIFLSMCDQNQPLLF